MDTAMTPEAAGETVPTVTVRYWAAIKAAAGVAEEQVVARTVGDALDDVRSRHRDSDRFADVLAACSVLVDARPLGTSDPAAAPVAPGSVVDLLPPFAGG